LNDGLGQALVHSETFAAPVARCAKALQLVEDRAPGLVLPLPDALDERIATDVAAVDLFFRKLTLNHHLSRNAGMVHAWLPQHVLAAHALEADHDVLQRVV